MNVNLENIHRLGLKERIRLALTDKLLKFVLFMICSIDKKTYKKVLSNIEPMIIIMNHINFLEVPIFVTQCYPILCTGLAKQETWNNPLLSYIFNSYKAIPIDRKGSYREIFKKIREEVIDNGKFVLIAPEGTRSIDGILREGKAGIVQLAIDTGLPIIPIAHYGGENVWKNMKHLKRTRIKLNPGRPFRIKLENGRPKREEREIILKEVMIQIARLLPERQRGVYADQIDMECKHLEFMDYAGVPCG
jgi:1-acyl-sn-glycerol-3-phosphate acyltransferase